MLTGRVQPGKGDAAHWLAKFNAAYARKVGMPVFPGSLNLALGAPFDWFAPAIARRTVTFDRTEYGGERDILLVPCVLDRLAGERAWLWTTTTAARDRPDPWVVEVIAATKLRDTYGLTDGSAVTIRLLDESAGAAVPRAGRGEPSADPRLDVATPAAVGPDRPAAG